MAKSMQQRGMAVVLAACLALQLGGVVISPPSASAEDDPSAHLLASYSDRSESRLSTDQYNDLLTPAKFGKLSGGIEIEIPGWGGEEVGVGFSEAVNTASYIAPLAATQVSTEAGLQAALSAQEPEIEITAGFPITSTNTIQANYDVLIFSDEASPVTLTRDSGFKGAFFLTTGGGKITLQNIVLDGGGDAIAGVTGSLVEANDQGTITLNTGAVLRNNVKSAGNGGGLNAIVNSTVYINEGSVVEYNKTPGENHGIGGGVYVSQSYPYNDASKLFVSGGTIQYNEAKGGGGGLATGSTVVEVQMTGGDIVYNKSTPDYLGGGVCTTGFFEFSGGSISHNIGTRGGGGVYVSSGEFTMTGGEISENEAIIGSGWGGGIWQGAGGYTQILGGSISDNKAKYGGGIYHEYYEPYNAKTGIVISGNAVISGNSATTTGGGVAILMPDRSATHQRVFELSGNAKITGNTSKDVGGLSIQAENANVNALITLGGDAEVSGNTASGQAGGIYLCGVDAEITDAFTVSGNTAKYGGGIRLMPFSSSLSTVLKLSDDVTVSGNTAELGGGVCLSSGVSLETADSVAIDGNFGDLGAGLFLLGSTATVGGASTIDGNNANLTGGSTANNAAGGIYLTQTTTGDTSTVNLIDTASVSDNDAVNETGGIIIDKGGILNVSDSVTILGNGLAGGSSGIAVYPNSTLNVWDTPQIGASDTDNGVFLASGMSATVPAGKDLLAGARINFEGLEDGAAEGALVAKRADASAAVTDESAFMAWTAGTYSVVRNASNTSEYVLEAKTDVDVLTIARLFGSERYETARQVANYERDISMEDVLIVASGHNYNFPDALAASSLSGANGNAPILLTDPSALPASTRTLIGQAASATKVYIIGDTPSVSSAVEAEIASVLPSAQIVRLAGETRMRTAELIFDEIGTKASKTAIIARSMDFPDSLSASSWAAYTVSPIFLTDFAETGLAQTTIEALASGGFERIVVMGSELSVPASVVNQALAATGLADVDVVRLGGADRVETSALFAEWATDSARGAEALSYDNLALTRADSHSDALAGGALQGMHGSVILLTWTDRVHPAVLSAIQAAESSVSEVRFFGDEKSVAVPTMRAYVNAIQFDEPSWKPDDSVAFDLS